jgi:hypothetical protein
MFLRSKRTRKFFNSPTDTPKLNSVSERNFRTLGEMALWLCSRDLDNLRYGGLRLTKLLDMYCDGSQQTQSMAT